MLDLKGLVNEQMTNNNMEISTEVTMNLKGLKINAKVMEGEELGKIFEEDMIR